MLNIQADSFYRVENPADHHIVSVRGPYDSYRRPRIRSATCPR